MDLPKDLEKYRLPDDEEHACPMCGRMLTHLLAKRYDDGLMFAYIHEGDTTLEKLPCFATVDGRPVPWTVVVARDLKPAPGIH